MAVGWGRFAKQSNVLKNKNKTIQPTTDKDRRTAAKTVSGNAVRTETLCLRITITLKIKTL